MASFDIGLLTLHVSLISSMKEQTFVISAVSDSGKMHQKCMKCSKKGLGDSASGRTPTFE